MVTQGCECAEYFQGLISSIVSLFYVSFPQPGLITIRVRSVAVTGIAVLAGFTRVSDPFKNFHNIWQGSTANPNALATALVKTNFAYVGSVNSFNLLGEVHGTNPVRTVRNAGFISLGIVTILFITVNLAYIAAVPLDEIKGSGQLVGALFFQHVFGTHWASKILPILVAFSCVGNIVCPIFDISYSAPADVLVWFTDGCCECLSMLRPTLSKE
jgi:amino acid transporter